MKHSLLTLDLAVSLSVWFNTLTQIDSLQRVSIFKAMSETVNGTVKLSLSSIDLMACKGAWNEKHSIILCSVAQNKNKYCPIFVHGAQRDTLQFLQLY